MEKLLLFFFVLQFPTDKIGCVRHLGALNICGFLAFSAERYVLYMTDMIVVMRYTSIDIPVKCESERSFLLFLCRDFTNAAATWKSRYGEHMRKISPPLTPCPVPRITRRKMGYVCMVLLVYKTSVPCMWYSVCAVRSLAQSAAAAGDLEKGARPSVQFKF